MGKSRDIASREDSGLAGFELVVDQNPIVHLNTRLLCQLCHGPHTYPDYHQIRRDIFAAAQGYSFVTYSRGRAPKTEHDTMLFVEASQEIGHRRTKEVPHGTSRGRHHRDLDSQRAKRGRDL
jgi:hypothetical protein